MPPLIWTSFVGILLLVSNRSQELHLSIMSYNTDPMRDWQQQVLLISNIWIVDDFFTYCSTYHDAVEYLANLQPNDYLLPD